MVHDEGRGGCGRKKRLAALFRCLDGDETAPYSIEAWLADQRERYPGRFITEILAEHERLDGPEYPAWLLDRVNEAEAFTQAFRMRRQAEQSESPGEAIKRLPQGGMFAKVIEIEFALRKGASGG